MYGSPGEAVIRYSKKLSMQSFRLIFWLAKNGGTHALLYRPNTHLNLVEISRHGFRQRYALCGNDVFVRCF